MRAVTDSYLEGVLERPQMYGAITIGFWEMLLLNLINYRSVLLKIDIDPRKVLFSLYIERYGKSCGPTGPASQFAGRFMQMDDEEVVEFYREFVKRCVELPE